MTGERSAIVKKQLCLLLAALLTAAAFTFFGLS